MIGKWYDNYDLRCLMMWVVYVIIIIVGLLVTGCEQRYTRSQWLQIMPADPNRATAQVIYEEGIRLTEIKAAHLQDMAKIQKWAIVASIALVAAAISLTYFGLGKLAVFALAGFVACFWGIVFVELDTHYPKFLPIGGGIVSLAFGVAAIYFFVLKGKIFKALKEVVGNVEDI